MTKLAILFGVLLIGLGLYGYLGQTPSVKPIGTNAVEARPATTEAPKASPTALIPAGFGLILLFSGFLGMAPERRKLAMHVAAGVALLGTILGGGRFLSKVGPLLNGDPSVNQRAIWFTGLLGLICLIYLLLSVRSFLAARRLRSGQAA